MEFIIDKLKRLNFEIITNDKEVIIAYNLGNLKNYLSMVEIYTYVKDTGKEIIQELTSSEIERIYVAMKDCMRKGDE